MQRALARIQNYLKHEDSLLGVVFAWLLGPAVGAVVGFYFGTIAGSQHVVDLQTKDMVNGAYGALAGLLLGTLVAVVVTVVYPKVVDRDEAHGHGHGH